MSLYAELLANIRQISLAASLPSPSDASTQVALTADCKTVELRHGSSVYQLALPAKTALGGTLLPIQDRQKGTTTLSWRLPLDASSTPSSSHQSDALPWSATDLDPSSAVACRQCSTVVVPAGAVNVWKDLPSENWAEMMEFWHCHKPDHVHGHGDDAAKADEKSLASRGYGSSSLISAQEGVGFVDLTTLLFAESDCRHLTVSSSDIAKSIHCLLGLLSSTLHLFADGNTWGGIKKVAEPAHDASMAWSPIQMPQINHTGLIHWWKMNLLEGMDHSSWWTAEPPHFAGSFTSRECLGIKGGT
jgi:hypothetical protein